MRRAVELIEELKSLRLKNAPGRHDQKSHAPNTGKQSGYVRAEPMDLRSTAKELAKFEYNITGAMEYLASKQGFDGLPGSGTIPGGFDLYRGFGSSSYADEYEKGKYFVGHGLSGSGTYAAISENKASNYAKEGGSVLHLQLQPDAKVVTQKELRDWRYDTRRKFDKEREDAQQKIIDKFDRKEISNEEGIEELSKASREYSFERLGLMTSEDGVLGTVLGYDAILDEGGDYVILNRSAVNVVDRKDY